MRNVELATAAVIMAMSAWFMWLATALPIGWEAASGPGGGAFPFWLSLGMLICATGVFVKQFRLHPSPMALKRLFIHPTVSGQMAVTAGAVIATTALTPILGAYVAIPLFLIGYVRVIGRCGWTLTLSLAVGTVLFMFFFFEVTLKILLPKGVTEPLFIPLYAMFF